ncbi:integration host factor, actinobacterial type [Nonomuraea sp. 3N208]|uniref:integration host factor, actinobacterial type n=1 Tax=Nonomuraea sp. 3N208 TaxID=3457421 RepID=UPI003FD0A21B
MRLYGHQIARGPTGAVTPSPGSSTGTSLPCSSAATPPRSAANHRTARSALLAGVKSGTASVAEVFGRSGEELVKKTRIAQVLRAVPGYGPARVAALMAVSGVAQKRRVGGLTKQQRERLLQALAG